MATAVFNRGFSGAGIVPAAILKNKEVTVESWYASEVITINTGTSNQLIAGLTVDFSQMVAVFIWSTVVMLIETNDSGTPADSISTVASVPYAWFTGDYLTCFITEDATAVYVTNASGTNGTIQFIVGYADSTP